MVPTSVCEILLLSRNCFCLRSLDVSNLTVTNMDTSFYQYEPLTYVNEIRLLHLEPGVTDDVHFTLHPVRLSDNPCYEAISYCWGDPNDTRVVYCEGKPLQVTVSLYTGLRRLRCRDAVRVLWADAVCINQNDTLEKNTQVPLMSRIYSQPSRVLIWLGEDSADIEGLQECIDGALAVLPPENYDFGTIYPISKQIFLQAYVRTHLLAKKAMRNRTG